MPFLFFRGKQKQNQILPSLISERHRLLEIETAFENELKVIFLPIFVGVHPACVARKILQGTSEMPVQAGNEELNSFL